MNATDKQRHFRSDFFLTGPLTDAQLALLLVQLACAAELCGARVSGGWVETDAAGEDVKRGESDAPNLS